MMRNLIFFILFIFSFHSISISQSPNRWRGPNLNGVYPETGLLDSWPEGGPESLWHFTGIGEGHASPALANGKIYTTGMIDQQGYIFILSMEGELLKKYPYGESWHQNFSGTRSTPVIVDDKIYYLSAQGKLLCMDENYGTIIWSKNVFEDFDGENIQWGITETLWIEGDKLFCSPGGKKNNVVALNRNTGDLIWSSPGVGDLSAYCSPIVIELSSRKVFVNMMASHIVGIDAETGELLWSHEHPNKWSVHANTPLYHDGKLFCFSGYGKGGVMLELSSDGSKIEKEWYSDTFDSRMGGAVLVDGYIYGSGDKNREWQSLNWETGNKTYESTEVGKGVVIAADGKLICYSERGELVLVEATPEAFKILGSGKVELGSAQHWSHPAIKGGILYLRHGDTMIAYKIK